ncbi:transcriptional regulator of RNA polII, SAGA, subunit-domain-containing protein [Halteromyces radiatus]|uniref:transcriptional regulator of RNA polII, SAGA, subunit-domain-containing protein n=1 Tax=Halteromyces radiatus TaxID=101107 RepID=UPI00221E4215|nr:transcriptional regulator of RNA polII, SAGA, subunit-domain-containing protein [Halteromyces radiatus]KAI8097405.1 transcriptional regulator of RNA polII, SAGA, subunit-domain-containing protein [Halteromyces radiatus]
MVTMTATTINSLKTNDPGSVKTVNGRKDVMALKQQLADCLGDNGPLYWDALRDFVMGKLNRQEFDFYANLYLSRQHAHLHNAFILSTIHNAQSATPPPSRQRTVGWKRKRGKDGHDQNPQKQKMKLDIMSLSKADRERLKALIKSGDKDRLRPFVNKLLAPRVSKPIPSSHTLNQLPSNFNMAYSRGLLAPLCSDLRELPRAGTLKARMTSIAMNHGLMGGVSEDAVYGMLFAMESYIKSALSNAISKCRYNRSVGLKMIQDRFTNHDEKDDIRKDNNDGTLPGPTSSSSLSSTPNPLSTAGQKQHQASLNLRDLAFSFRMTPYVLVENLLNAERMTALITDSEDEETDEDLDDSDSDSGNDFII